MSGLSAFERGGSNPKSVHAAMVARFGLHNSGHLVWVRQRGAQPARLSPQDRLWAGWQSYEEGVEGVRRQVHLDISLGLTLRELISKYAPAVENQTETYIRNVVTSTQLLPNVPVFGQPRDSKSLDPLVP